MEKDVNFFASDTLRMVRANIVRNGARLILKKSKMTLGGAVLLRKMRREITAHLGSCRNDGMMQNGQER